MSKALAPILKQYLQFIKTGQGFESIIKKIDITSVGDGKCNAEFTVQPDQANAFGYLHGSFSASLVDMISGIALLSHERIGGGVSVNMNISYLKGAEIGDVVTVEARTLRAGKNLGFLEVEIKNKETGDLLVTATHTKFIG